MYHRNILYNYDYYIYYCSFMYNSFSNTLQFFKTKITLHSIKNKLIPKDYVHLNVRLYSATNYYINTRLTLTNSEGSTLIVTSQACTCDTVCILLTNAGSLFRHESTNSLKDLEKSPLRVGGVFFGMWKRTRMGCMSELGGSPLASSIAVMPSDQISAWKTTWLTRQHQHQHQLQHRSLCVYLPHKHHLQHDTLYTINSVNNSVKTKKRILIGHVRTSCTIRRQQQTRLTHDN